MKTKNDRASWITGGRVPCSILPKVTRANPLRFVLLGAPGVGKGTQAERISEYYGVCHLSTGDVFRAAKDLQEKGTASPTMTRALNYMLRGDLVPDEIVLELIHERMRCLMCGGGFMLDGFPRTVAQAEALSEFLEEKECALTAVLNYELPIDQVVARLSGRRTCPGCKAVFHVTAQPPKVEGVCDHCGESLYQREDDVPESVRVRMDAYEANTRPLIEYYSKRDLLVTVEADGSPAEIFNRTKAKLKNVGPEVSP